MIRYRRAVPFASGAVAQQFGPAWKFRVVVSCPPAETVTVQPVRESSPKDAYTFGPGDSGWLTLPEKYSAILVAKGAGGATASVDVWWADEKGDEVHTATPAVTSPIGAVIYDSGAVAAGAAIASGVLDLSTLSALEIIVDNTAGTVLRDLSLLSYLSDGATLIDTVAIRRCAFGAAPAGSSYAPGRIRGYVGPNPPGGTTGAHVLYDATSAVNTALDTGNLVTEDLDQVCGYSKASPGAAHTIYAYRVHDDGTQVWIAQNSVAADPLGIAVGAGSGGLLGTGATAGVAMGVPVERRLQFKNSAVAGNTTRLTVMGRGRVPGTFAHQIALPTRAAVQLAAGGAGAARLTVIGR